MSIRLGRFEMPKTLVQDEAVGTPTFARFTAEPFEAGYGHTVGNCLRRVLLSSLEGAAITAVRINGAPHEFTHLENVVEDVTDIVLNLKTHQVHDRMTMSLRTLTSSWSTRDGAVTAGDIQDHVMPACEVLNKDQHICTLDKQGQAGDAETRGAPSAAASPPATRTSARTPPIGTDPDRLDLLARHASVKYAVENTRVGQRTDYDKLILESHTPTAACRRTSALQQASAILRRHLDRVRGTTTRTVIEFEPGKRRARARRTQKLKKLLNMSVNEIELSVRAANCLNNANITTVGQLARRRRPRCSSTATSARSRSTRSRTSSASLGLTPRHEVRLRHGGPRLPPRLPPSRKSPGFSVHDGLIRADGRLRRLSKLQRPAPFPKPLS